MTLMRVAGFLEPAGDRGDRRHRLLKPTERLMAIHREHWDFELRAIAMLFPDVARAHAAIHREEFAAAFVRQIVEPFRAGFRLLELTPELLFLAERSAGLSILFTLMGSGAADDVMPPRRPVPMSISDLARRYHVSRAHVLKLLRDAQARGLIAREGSDQLRLLPKLIEMVELLFAIIFAFTANGACVAIDQIERNERKS